MPPTAYIVCAYFTCYEKTVESICVIIEEFNSHSSRKAHIRI